jgi:plastocyanin
MQGGRLKVIVLVAVTAGALAAPAVAGPPPTEVSVVDDEFLPKNVEQILGSSTHWTWDDGGDGFMGDHNVREDSKMFYSGPFTDDPGHTFTTSVASGKYRYHCEVHSGMDGTVKARPLVGPADVDSFVVTWGAANVQKPSRYDVKYRVGDGRWKDWVKNKTAIDREFGANDNPVDVRSGVVYGFKARTELKSNPQKSSRFSPVTPFALSR